MNDTIDSYEDLLNLARAQKNPQRLLFVFANAEIESDANEQQRAAFNAGIGGLLKPVMCVDKPVDELSDFNVLVNESDKTGHAWTVMFVACLSGVGGVMPSAEDANKPLDLMISSINQGMVSQYLAFTRKGELLTLEVS